MKKGRDVSPPALAQRVTFSPSIFLSVSQSSHFVSAPVFGGNFASEAENLPSHLPICACDGGEPVRGLLLPNTLSSCFFKPATQLPISPCEILISSSQMGSTRIMSITPDLLIECCGWKNQAERKGGKKDENEPGTMRKCWLLIMHRFRRLNCGFKNKFSMSVFVWETF